MIYAIGTGEKFFASITVEYPPNTICTCSKDAYSFTATNIGQDSTGTWEYCTFLVPEAGDWTVTLTKGKEQKILSVTIEEQYDSIFLEKTNFRLYLWDKGAYDTGSGGFTYSSGTEVGAWAQATRSTDGSQWYQHTDKSETRKTVKLSRYSKIYFNLTANEAYHPGGNGYRRILLNDIILATYTAVNGPTGIVDFDLSNYKEQLENTKLILTVNSGNLANGSLFYNSSSLYADQIWVE